MYLPSVEVKRGLGAGSFQPGGGGLGFIPLIIMAAATVASKVVAAKISKSGGPNPLTEQEFAQLQLEEQKKQRQQIILMAAGGVLLVSVLITAIR